MADLVTCRGRVVIRFRTVSHFIQIIFNSSTFLVIAMESQDRLPDGVSHRNRVSMGITAMVTFLATIFVGLRLASRLLTVKIKSDDWVCLAALIFAYATLTTTVLTDTVGRSGWDISQYDRFTIERRSKIVLANNCLYNTTVSLAKISIILYYRRIFTTSRTFVAATWAMGGLILGYWLACIFGLIFAYNPVQAQWKSWLPHTSINNQAFWMAMGIINIVYNITILCMAQPLVFLLWADWKSGGFTFTRLNQFPWTDTLYLAGIWTAVESNLSIICACLPMLPSLVKHFRGRSERGLYSAGLGESRMYLRRLDGAISFSKATAKGSNSFINPNTCSQVRIQTDVDIEWDPRRSSIE
ncbi:hypothetical protein AN3241.2 [Aspergillus nidulans FGSC A4]|uniref:Rhodopsin domain-containing protein n=1 Tax=Emericella nidulans (strain FGSC A4 / ATCC 38163 / CBS 112.46 / NRRL 194 / M139) TaxID=227321 RepID=Q5B889_EMENI|nr:hypothetical protein [Aspergillus nidulans FGSC A4]EAA63142.1 hypothetical protein AN3241.2 [Aspergillus nidulans FGSC A4]CBF83116.1 TPA: hypothetical protein ANIA_03241 [Aspergillus nidulans FGSC A4]|eukprot:XP_660845.1 hypothetical protein AN3241.2 [Aspergillus nidulans FGSC A4]